MKSRKTIEDVSTWYKTEGWYKQLLFEGYRVIKPYLTGKTLLEIGPADGVMTKLLHRHFTAMTLLEPAHIYVQYLQKQFPDAKVVETTVEDFHPKTTYDTIVMAHVLEHIEDFDRALRKLRPAMHKKSRLIIIVPNAHAPQRRISVALGIIPKLDALNRRDKRLDHKRVYTLDLLKQHITRAGFHIQQSGNILFGMDIYCIVTGET